MNIRQQPEVFFYDGYELKRYWIYHNNFRGWYKMVSSLFYSISIHLQALMTRFIYIKCAPWQFFHLHYFSSMLFMTILIAYNGMNHQNLQLLFITDEAVLSQLRREVLFRQRTIARAWILWSNIAIHTVHPVERLAWRSNRKKLRFCSDRDAEAIILEPLPLPRFRFRSHENVVLSLVAIPPTNVEAADPADRFRFRIPGDRIESSCTLSITPSRESIDGMNCTIHVKIKKHGPCCIICLNRYLHKQW